MQADFESASRRERKAAARVARLEDEKAALLTQIIDLQKENLSLCEIASSHPSLVRDLEEANARVSALTRKLESRTSKFRAIVEEYRSTIEELSRRSELNERPAVQEGSEEIENLRSENEKLLEIMRKQRKRISALEESAEDQGRLVEENKRLSAENKQLRRELIAKTERTRVKLEKRRESDEGDVEEVKRENEELVAQVAQIEQKLSDSRNRTRDLLSQLEHPAKLENQIAALTDEQESLAKSVSELRERAATYDSELANGSPASGRRTPEELTRENKKLRMEVERQRRANEELRRSSKTQSTRSGSGRQSFS
jgi:chromosome segregation ATPase